MRECFALVLTCILFSSSTGKALAAELRTVDRQLGAEKDVKEVSQLCEPLRSGDVAIRRSAALKLFHIAAESLDRRPVLESKALSPLTDAIGDDDQQVRSLALKTLGRMGESAKPSLDRIIATLKQPSPPFGAIAEAVEGIGPDVMHLDDLFEAAERMSQMSEKGREWGPLNYGHAIGMVGENGVERVIRALDDRRETVRKTAMWALYYLGPKAAPAVPKVIRKLNNGDPVAPHVLGEIGPNAAEAVPHLVRRLEKDEWWQPRISLGPGHPWHMSKCADALAAIGRPAIPALLEGLKHHDELVKAGCMVALAEMDATDSVKLSKIKPFLNHKNGVISNNAIRALVRHGDRKVVVPILERLARESYPSIAQRAQWHLDNLNEAKD